MLQLAGFLASFAVIALLFTMMFTPAVRGHATVPPSSVMNSRRLIRPPCRRGRAKWAGFPRLEIWQPRSKRIPERKSYAYRFRAAGPASMPWQGETSTSHKDSTPSSVALPTPARCGLLGWRPTIPSILPCLMRWRSGVATTAPAFAGSPHSLVWRTLRGAPQPRHFNSQLDSQLASRRLRPLRPRRILDKGREKLGNCDSFRPDGTTRRSCDWMRC
jgi:hypothetical protein